MKWDAVFPRVVRLQARLGRGYTARNDYVPDTPARSSGHAYPGDD